MKTEDVTESLFQLTRISMRMRAQLEVQNHFIAYFLEKWGQDARQRQELLAKVDHYLHELSEAEKSIPGSDGPTAEGRAQAAATLQQYRAAILRWPSV